MLIPLVWFIFAILFFLLGLYHWHVSKKEIPPFRLSERPGKNAGSVKVLGADIDQPIEDFVQDFNDYVSRQNELSKKQNRRSASGYWLASLTALGSMFL